MLELANVSASLAGKPLFGPLNITVEPGEIVTLMGPSGCGKSTLLSWICGTLEGPFLFEGQVRLSGEDLIPLATEKRRVGILFQDDLLFPHLSVGDNLAFGLSPSVAGRKARRQRIAEALAEAGLEGFEDRHVDTLSGGQKARISLLRTLLSEPRALLLDEPFSSLDVDLRQKFRELVFSKAKASALPVILVTHDPSDAPEHGRILQL